MTELIFSFFSILFFITVFVYFPGKVISDRLKLPCWIDLNIIIGISLLLPYLYFLQWLSIPAALLLVLYLLLFIALYFKWHIKLNFDWPKISLITVVLLIGVIAQSWTNIASLLKGEEYVRYELYASHDQAWHAALIAELINEFPPQTPGYAGNVLKNYHYFYDLLIAANIQITGGDVVYAVQVFYPIFVSILFGLSIYRSITKLTSKKVVHIFTIILSYFGNNLAYFLQIFNYSDWRSDTFLLDQPLIYLYNHQTVLSVALLLYICILFRIFQERQKNYSTGILISIMLTALMGVKIYGFAVAVISLFLTGLYLVIKALRSKTTQTVKQIMVIGITSTILCGINYALSFRREVAFFSYNPGWILDQFFIRNILPHDQSLAYRRAIYQYNQDSIKLFVINAFTFCLYLLGNLNIRLFGFFSKWRKNILSFMLVVCSLVSLSMLLLGNQTASAFNIIQFGPYAVIPLTILTGYFISTIKNKVMLTLIIVMMLVVSLPTSLKTINTYGLDKNVELNDEFISSLEYLKNYPRGTVLVIQNDYRHSNVIGAVAEKPAYFYDKTQLEVLQKDHTSREEWVKFLTNNFCMLSTKDEEQFTQEHIRYIIVPAHLGCMTFKKIYESARYVIYQLY